MPATPFIREHFSFDGQVLIRKKGTSHFRLLGNCPDFQLTLKRDKTKLEGSNGEGTIDVRYGSPDASLKLKTSQFDPEIAAMALHANSLAVVGGSVTNESFATLEVGGIYKLAHGAVSAVTLKDSTGTPLSLTEGTHYRLDPQFGTFEVLSITGPFVMPVKANYTYASAVNVGIFSTDPTEYEVLFKGNNKAQSGREARLSLWRVTFDPAKVIDLISNKKFGELDLEAELLADPTAPNNAQMGQLGVIEML
ncbi:MAG: hypothetical protein NT086_08925 [Proteobacteria bacterium]|nr:hypothetical protein [Pseudomonadota bacterium]